MEPSDGNLKRGLARDLGRVEGVEARARPGDLWALGRHRLLVGDATDPANRARVLDGGRAGTIFFDPPYDAPQAVVGLRPPCRHALVLTDHRHVWELIQGWAPPFRGLFTWNRIVANSVPHQPLGATRHCFWFGGDVYRDDWRCGRPTKRRRVRRGKYQWTVEPCAAGERFSTIYHAPATMRFAGHPHAKPLEWVACLLGNCTTGDVLDPYAGVGTALIAAEIIGRACYAIELEPANADIILWRWERFADQRATRL